MRVFELHFNPKLKEDLIFDTFCYEPENIYEKKLGSLYLAGELKNVLPQNLKFLDSLADIIKKEYYSQFRQKPEIALKESLKKANEHLEKIAKKGDVSWLGNLNFIILDISFQKNFWELNLTKTGNIKILLLRGNKITDISKNLEIQGLEPYPLKIFVNIVSGKLSPLDKIIVLTNQIYDFFVAHDLLKELTKISVLDEKKLKEILKFGEKEFSEISGICLICDLSLPKIEEKEKKPIVFKKALEKFSWTEVFSPIIKFPTKILKVINKIFENLLNLFRIRRFFDKLTSPFYKLILLPQKIKVLINPVRDKISNGVKHKNTILVLTFIFLLAIGFFIFQREKELQFKEIEVNLNKIEEKIVMAEGFLVLKETNLEAFKRANSLLKEAWDEVLPLTKKESPFKNKAISLKNSIETNLFNLNKLEMIPEPKVIFEFEPEKFVPQKMVYFKENLYFFSPFSNNLFKVNTKGEGSVLETSQGFNLAVNYDNAILFFSKPNKLTVLKEDNFKETLDIKEPYSEFNFNDFSSYKGNLYFLDSKRGEIIKYPAPLESGINQPKLWLDQKTPHQSKLGAGQAKSMAMDGSIWILNKENAIDRYSAGKYQKTLNLNFFPYPKTISQIFTSPALPYLYLLEPVQSRVIIIDKNGNIIKQFQSEKFDNLNDLAVSADGKTIWLLNGLIVYQLKF